MKGMVMYKGVKLAILAIAIIAALLGCESEKSGGTHAVAGVTLKTDMGIQVLVPDGWAYIQDEQSVTITKGDAVAKIWRVVGGSEEESENYIKTLAEKNSAHYIKERLFHENFYYIDHEEDDIWTREYIGFVADKYNTFHMIFKGTRTDVELRAIEEGIII
jgi:hypothetical protein